MTLVRLSRVAGIATITLDSPANRNALSRQLMTELGQHLATTASDDAVRVVVLTHTGSVFCSGMDLKESAAADQSGQGVNAFPELLKQVWHHPRPVLARLDGTARAGGTGLAAACDLVVARDDITFGFSEVRLGLIPAVISVLLAHRVQARPMHRLLLTGEPFAAARAVEIGLIDSAVPADGLDAEVDRLVGLLALGGPSALAATKRLVNADLSTALADASELSAAAFASQEGREGLASFAEKRPARWVG